MRVQLQPAYVLHTQAYSNTSLLLDIFSRDYGRIRLIAKGVRAARSTRRALLQPFVAINISWSGRSDLKTLTDVELDSDYPSYPLKGDALFNGLYINELLIKLTYPNDPHDDVFLLYRNIVNELSYADNQEFCLRYFEYQLLEYLGYSLAIEGLEQLGSQYQYQYQPEQGLVLFSGMQSALPIIQGHYLSALYNKQQCDDNGMRQLKNLMRFVLHYHLDGKKIQSRVLYQ